MGKLFLLTSQRLHIQPFFFDPQKMKDMPECSVCCQCVLQKKLSASLLLSYLLMGMWGLLAVTLIDLSELAVMEKILKRLNVMWLYGLYQTDKGI